MVYSRSRLALVLVIFALGCTQPVEASLVFNLGGKDITNDSGGEGSDLASSVVRMEFSEFASGVYLDVYFNNLAGVKAESKLESILFNYNGDMPQSFSIVVDDTWVGANGYTTNNAAFEKFDIASDSNEFKYGDNGLFDLKVFFFTKNDNQTDHEDAFNANEAIRLKITGIDSNIQLFNELSTDGQFKAAMHVLDTANDNSGHYGGQAGFGGDGDPVPEPGAIAIWSMIGLGAVGGAAWRRRRNKAA
jgi:hypothetical protein